MRRVAARWIAVRFVVLAVACMMVVSITGSGGYVFFQAGSGKALSVSVPFQGVHKQVGTGEDDSETHASCSDTLGMEALGESFAPECLPPSDGGFISPATVRIARSAFHTRIYRPPIS